MNVHYLYIILRSVCLSAIVDLRSQPSNLGKRVTIKKCVPRKGREYIFKAAFSRDYTLYAHIEPHITSNALSDKLDYDI